MANENRITLIIDANGNAAIEGFNKITGSMKKMETETGGIVSKIKQHWLALSATVIAAYATISKASEYISLGAKAQQAEESFHRVAASLNEDANKILADMKRVSAGTVDDSDIMQKAVKGMIQGLSGNQLVKIMEAARISARVTGEDVGTAYETITDSIANNLPRALIRYGLVTKEQTKIVNQAITAGIEDIRLYDFAMANAEKQSASFGQVTESNAEKLQKINASFQDLKETIGKFLIEGIGKLAMGWEIIGATAGSAMLKIKAALSLNFGEFKNIDADYAKTIEDIQKKWGQGGEAAKNFGGDVSAANNKIKELEANLKKQIGMKKLAEDAKKAADEIKKLNEHIQDMIDKSTLTPVGLIEKQAETWRNVGANRISIEKWTQMELEKLNLEYGKKIMEQNEQWEKQRMDDILADYDLEQRIWEAREQKIIKFSELAIQQAEKTRASIQGMWDMMMQGANLIGGEAGQGFGQAMSAYTEISGGLDPYAEKLRLLDEYYQARLIKMYEAGANEQALMNELSAWDLQTTALTQMQKLNTYAQTANMIMGVMGMMGSFMKGHNTALFLLQKAAAIAITIVNAHAAAVAAVAPPPMGLGPILGIPLAAKMMTFGYINAAIIAATAIGEMAGGGRDGASIPSAGGYSYNQPTTPSWEKTEEVKKGKQITIHIHGNIIDHAAFVRELAPYINEAQGDNVLVFE